MQTIEDKIKLCLTVGNLTEDINLELTKEE